jgi:hypothetical protein
MRMTILFYITFVLDLVLKVLVVEVSRKIGDLEPILVAYPY